MMREGFQKCCGNINNIAEGILVLSYSSKFVLTEVFETVRNTILQLANAAMLLSNGILQRKQTAQLEKD